MKRLMDKLIKLENGMVALVVAVEYQNQYPVTDFVVKGNEVPEDRRYWDSGERVIGFDVSLQFEDGIARKGWIADNDWLIQFYDYEEAWKSLGYYSLIFSDQAFMGEDGEPGMPVGTFRR